MSNRGRALLRLAAVLVLVSAIGLLVWNTLDKTRGERIDTDVDQAVAVSGKAQHEIGLMTSLPLLWPLGVDFAAMIDGNAEAPWARTAMETSYTLRPLDTLSGIAGLTADEPPTDPLAGLERLAIIQPRGLSPADNVALDEWVRAGGRLLLVLDPMLTGEYDLALGDPRLPVITALVPPIVPRWGLAIGFDEMQEPLPRIAELPQGNVPLLLAGEISATSQAGEESICSVHQSGAIARCSVGEGRVTLFADAAVFEHQDATGEDGRALIGVLHYAFD